MIGRVIHGDGQGKALGYPTANLAVDLRTLDTPDGVYAAWAVWQGKRYPAAVIISRVVDKYEVHLIDSVLADFYGDELRVDIAVRVSDIERCASVEELKEKIDSDIRDIRNVLFGEKKS